MNAKDILNNAYSKIDSNDGKAYHHILFTIVNIKSENIHFINYKYPLYVEIKNFINEYINSVENRNYGYDMIRIDKISRAIECTSIYREQYELSLYAARLLQINGFEAEIVELKPKVDKYKTKVLKLNTSVTGRIRLFSHLCSYNLFTVFLILLFVFFISNLIFLPAPTESMTLFHINYMDYASNFYLNHVLNIFSLAIGLQSEQIVVPLNGWGVIVYALLKCAYILLIVNYLYQKLLNIFYEN